MAGGHCFHNGAKELSYGAGKLYEGSREFGDGINGLGFGSQDLTNGSNYILNALQSISGGLSSGAGKIDLSQLTQLPAVLLAFAGGLNGISSGLSELSNGFSGAFAALNNAVEAIPDTSITEGDILDLYAAAPQYSHVIAELAANYQAAQMIRGINENVSPVFSAVDGSLPALAESIDTMSGALKITAAEISSVTEGMDIRSLDELLQGISMLAENYEIFHSGLVSYTNGVNTLANEYTEMEKGIKHISDGATELSNGVGKLANGAFEFYIGMKEFSEGIKELAGGVSEFSDGTLEFSNGVVELSEGTAELLEGVVELADGASGLLDGVSKTADGTFELADGAGGLAGGMAEFLDGIGELADGTGELHEESQKIPDKFNTAIDEMLARYDKSSFSPVSFVSERNQNVEFVQFIIKTEKITKPEVIEEIEDTGVEATLFGTLWARLVALFKKER